MSKTNYRYAIIANDSRNFTIWQSCDRESCETFHRKIATCESELDAKIIVGALDARQERKDTTDE